MKPLSLLAAALIVLIVALFLNQRFSSRPVAATSPVTLASSDEPSVAPAAATRGNAASATASSSSSRNVSLYQLFISRGNVSRDAIERFVAASGRSAPSLLAAWAESQDAAWLKEAGERYPLEPAVQFVFVCENAFPEDRAKWLQRLRESSPENGAVDFVASSDLIRAGQPAAGLDQLRAGMAKPVFDDFSGPLGAARDALMSASYADPVEAQARFFAERPHRFFDLVLLDTNTLFDDQKAAQARGDQAASTADLELALKIGQVMTKTDGPPLPILETNGINVEARALRLLLEQSGTPPDPAAAARLAELRAMSDDLVRLGDLVDQATLADPLLPEYLARSRTEGLVAALRWYARQKGL